MRIQTVVILFIILNFIWVFFLILFPSLTTKNALCHYTLPIEPTTSNPQKVIDQSVHDFVITSKLIKLAKEIRKAKKHVRGTKTGDALTQAQKTITDILKDIDINFMNITKRPIQKSDHVCPEVYKGSLFGYHLYNTGFVVQNCSNGKPINELITIVLLLNKQQTFDVNILLRSIKDTTYNIPIVFGHMALDVDAFKEFENIKIMDFSEKEFEGKAWNYMIANVTTPYTLVARDVMWFNHDARLDRLVRQIERLNVSSAGGAYRDIKGHWMRGCQQRVFRNFTLVYDAGYDESIEECLVCDHVDGPFVSKTEQLTKIKFNEKIKSQGLFEDFFVRFSRKEHVVCPDSMFYTNRTERSYIASDWASFQSQWKVKKIKFSGRDILMGRPRTYPCFSGRGTSLNPWCQEENANLVYSVMKGCEYAGLICELSSSSLLGTVKFHAILPWERDADLFYIKNNSTNTQVKNAIAQWSKMGYGVSIGRQVINIRSKHWRLELFEKTILSSQHHLMNNQTSTLCSMNGHWVRMPRNPGLVARNRYGKEIFQHAQHWSDTGLKTGWGTYRTNRFIPCGSSEKYNCLDRYNGDGNLQFRDPVP